MRVTVEERKGKGLIGSTCSKLVARFSQNFPNLTLKLITFWCFYIDAILNLEGHWDGEIFLQDLIGTNTLIMKPNNDPLMRSRVYKNEIQKVKNYRECSITGLWD